MEFYDRLLAHGNEDLDLYKSQALKTFTNFKWPLVKESQALKTYTNFNWPLVKDHVIW